jgi:hypothetical protein
MLRRSWPSEGEALESFQAAITTLDQVVGEPVILRVSEGDKRRVLEVYGTLARVGVHPDSGGILFRVGDKAYLELSEAEFSWGRRSSTGGGSFWGITVSQGQLVLHIGEDKNASR